MSDGDSRPVFSTDGGQVRPPEQRAFSDEPSGPPKERRSTRTRPEPPTLPRNVMRYEEVPPHLLEPTASPSLFSTPVPVGEDWPWEYLTKELKTVQGKGGVAKIDLFWLEKEREQLFDLMWGKLPAACKFKVPSGPRMGWVGYFRITA